MPELRTRLYQAQSDVILTSTRSIRAQFNQQSVVVYQVCEMEAGHFAAEQGSLYGAPGFEMGATISLTPTFLAAMAHSDWANRKECEVILAVWLDRVGFDALLRKSVPDQFLREFYADEAQWQQARTLSSVRTHWGAAAMLDADSRPSEALWISLRGKSSVHFAHGGWINAIVDITDFVHEQRMRTKMSGDELLLPEEDSYPVYDSDIELRLGMGAVR